MIDRLDLVIENELIDHGTSDDYYTPPSVFEALNVQFDLDVAGPPGGGAMDSSHQNINCC